MNFISTLIFINLCWFLVKCSSACPSGWFGSKCQFQCHCASKCDVITGQCLNRSRCAPGWFGVACQYLDLTNASATIITDSTKSTNSWITDGNDSTCNADINLHAVTVTWNQTFPFTWLRLTLNDINNLESVIVKFKTNRTKVAEMSCEEQRIFLIDTKTADIRCHVMLDVMQVTIAGRGVNSLCSLYINGGRNVALKQGAVQSSTYKGDGPLASLASNAVDGNTNGYIANHSCTNTETGDPSPHWTVTFVHPQLVNRFVLYNRIGIGRECGGLCPERLKNFTLESFDSKNTTVFRYQDSSATALTVYTVTVPGRLRDSPVSALQINATVLPNRDTSLYLTLCEFEAYGDCVPGTWGLDCSNTCNKSCNTSCHEETGACQVCIGFSNPPTCDISCRVGQWGMNCLQSCSTKCLDASCDKATGICDSGCHGYDDPPACNKESSNSTTAIGIAFGLTVGGLLAIILVLTICLWRRRDHDRAINYDNVMPSGEDDHEYEMVGNSKQHQQKTRTAKDDEKTTPPADHRPDNDYEVDNVNRYDHIDFQKEAPSPK